MFPLPLSSAVQVLCSLGLEWLGTGRRTLKSFSLLSWPKASAAVVFYTDKFCCKVCLRFLENANKKLEIFPNRMLCYYEIVWTDVSVTVIQTQLQEANVAGERKTEDTLLHLQVFCPLSHKLTFLAVETLSLVYCFNLFTAFLFLNS